MVMGLFSLLFLLLAICVVEIACWFSFRRSLKGIDFEMYGNLNLFSRKHIRALVIAHTAFLFFMAYLIASTLQIL